MLDNILYSLRGGGGEGYSWEFLEGVCRVVSQILTLFQTQKYHFPHLFSDQISKIHTHFQTWPLGINYVIITDVRAQTKKLFKSISNLHICLSFFEMVNTFIHYTHFQTKKGQKPTLWGGTYLYGLCKGVPPPPPPPGLIHDTFHLCTCLRTGGLKMMPCGFSGSKQVINSANSQSSLSILD